MQPLASFDDVMDYMELVEKGLPPEKGLEDKRAELLAALKELGSEYAVRLQQRREEIAKISAPVLQKVAKETHLLAVNEQIPVLERTFKQGTEGLELLQTAVSKANSYYNKLMEENGRLQKKLKNLSEGLKNKPRFGANQEAIVRFGDAIANYVSK